MPAQVPLTPRLPKGEVDVITDPSASAAPVNLGLDLSECYSSMRSAGATAEVGLHSGEYILSLTGPRRDYFEAQGRVHPSRTGKGGRAVKAYPFAGWYPEADLASRLENGRHKDVASEEILEVGCLASLLSLGKH